MTWDSLDSLLLVTDALSDASVTHAKLRPASEFLFLLKPRLLRVHCTTFAGSRRDNLTSIGDSDLRISFRGGILHLHSSTYVFKKAGQAITRYEFYKSYYCIISHSQRLPRSRFKITQAQQTQKQLTTSNIHLHNRQHASHRP